ncbi:hypothetical protein IVB08_21965 [Bradyrhizobium sp. 173]|nr:hypothetical protein [Bradyrhizobium sp. 173]
MNAVRDGVGFAYIFEDQVAADIASGSLARVLEGWCPPVSGHHVYSPSRRQTTQAFSVLIDATEVGLEPRRET